MGDLGKTVRLSELTEQEQCIVREFFPLIKKHFASIKIIFTDVAEGKFALDKYNYPFIPGVKDFIEVFIDVFTISPRKSVSAKVEEKDEEKEKMEMILNQCTNKFREVVRKGFRGVYYMTPGDLHKCFEEASTEAEAMLDYLVERFLSSERQEELKKELEESFHSKIDIQEMWIKDINMFQRKRILESIKSEILESFKNQAEMKFPFLYGGSETHFYGDSELKRNYNKIITSTLQVFERQVPFQEDEQDLDEMINEYEKELREKVADDIVRRNAENRSKLKSIMEEQLNQAILTYQKSMSVFMENEPLMDSSSVLERHDLLKNELTPNFGEEAKARNLDDDAGMEKLRVKCLNQYHNQLHENFNQLLNQVKDTASSHLVKLQTRSEEITRKYLEEIHAAFEESKVASTFVDALGKKFEGDVTQCFLEIKENTLANPKSVENLLVKCKPKRILTIVETILRYFQISEMLEKLKKHYVDEMQKYSSLNKNKQPDKGQHETVKNQTVKLFHIEMRGKFGEEPSNSYVKDLKEFADMKWEENERKRKSQQLLSAGNLSNVPYFLSKSSQVKYSGGKGSSFRQPQV